MERYLPTSILESIGLTLLHSVWELTLIGLALYLLLISLSKSSARIRYAVSVIALAFMALAPILTFFLLYTPDLPGNGSLAAIAWLAQASEPISPQPGESLSLLENILFQYRSISTYIVGIWLTGAILLAIRLLGGYLYTRQLRRNGTSPVPAKLQEKLITIRRKMGMLHPVSLMASAKATVPMALGHFKPIILLPVSMLSGLTDTQIECILVHELAHIRRYDYLINLCQRTIEIAFFFHPAIWIVSKYIRKEREDACDEIVVSFTKNKLEYVHTLLQIENLKSKSTLAMSATGGNLIARIKLIMEQQQQKPNYGHGALFLVLFAVAIGLFLWNGNHESDDPNNERVNLASIYPAEPATDIILINDQAQEQFNFSVPQDSPIKKVTIITKDGEKIQSTLDSDGEIESLKVNGQEVSDDDFDKYAARINHAMKGNVSVSVEDFNSLESTQSREDMERELARIKRKMNTKGGQFDAMEKGMEGFETLMEGLGEMLETTIGASLDGEISKEDEAKIEEWGDQFGEEMEAWGEDFGKEMEEWGENFEQKMENGQDWDKFEEKWEKWGEKFGAKMEIRAERLERIKENGSEEEYQKEMEAFTKELSEGLGGELGEMMQDLTKNLSIELSGITEDLAPRMEKAQRKMEEAQRRMEKAQPRLERAERELDHASKARRKAEQHEKSLDRLLKSELIRDRLIEKGDSYKFSLNQKNVRLNGKKLSKAHHKKYLDLLNDHTLIDLKKAGKFELEFED